MTAILTLEPILTPNTCTFLIDHQNNKVIGLTAAVIPLVGVDLRAF